MAVILGLLIFCLGIYFLGLFFQVARLEKEMIDGVTLLEKFMIVTYSLDQKPKSAEEDAAAQGAQAQDKGPPKAPDAAKPGA